MEGGKDVAPTGASGSLGGSSDRNSGTPVAGGTAGSGNGGGASRAGDRDGSSSNSGAIASGNVSVKGASGSSTIGNQRSTSGRNDVGPRGIRPPPVGSDPGGSAGNGDRAERGTGGSTEAPTQQLVGRVDETSTKGDDDAEEELQRPSYVGIPRSTKKEKNQNAPAPPRKGKATDVDSETIALGISVAFEVPAIVCQLITPLQGGHPWWSKSPDEVSVVAEPLTQVINGMSPKIKKLVKENTAGLAVLVGIASLVQEPIAMEIALHREIQVARQQVLFSGLPEIGATSNGSAPKRNKRPSGGLAAARAENPSPSIEENEGDFAF